jgi:hypothetical protein
MEIRWAVKPKGKRNSDFSKFFFAFILLFSFCRKICMKNSF